jgi:hypothetical protein
MTANTPQSRKARGRTAQNLVRDKFRAHYVPVEEFPGSLVPEDIVGRQMGGSGTDLVLTPSAQRVIPFDVEVKCQQSLNIWAALKQCEDNTAIGKGRIPLLCFKRNNTQLYATLRLDDLLRIIK